jgi:hypothetical protein
MTELDAIKHVVNTNADTLELIARKVGEIETRLDRIERALSVLGSIAGDQMRIELILKGFGDVG